MSDRGSPDAVQPVLTIGHSTRSLAEFLELLEIHGVTRLVDVRTLPRSRRHPHFGRESLARELSRRGLLYEHLPALGGLRRPRGGSSAAGSRSDAFRGFAEHMRTREFRDGLGVVEALAREGRVALMCAEAAPRRCHRYLIADALVARGERVEHILDRGARAAHVLVPWAPGW